MVGPGLQLEAWVSWGLETRQFPTICLDDFNEKRQSSKLITCTVLEQFGKDQQEGGTILHIPPPSMNRVKPWCQPFLRKFLFCSYFGLLRIFSASCAKYSILVI